MEALLWLIPVAFLAGFVDAVVGGGGLVQLPALFTALPEAPPATALGVNKVSSICGTGVAALRYASTVKLRVQALTLAFGGGLLCSFGGAATVSVLPKEAVRPVVLVLLIVVGAYTLVRKDLGARHAPRLSARREGAAALLLGCAMGFYDGFFGPGAGAFMVFVFVRVFGYDFLHASASAKVVNFATNLGALVYFGIAGSVLWGLAAGMAACNVAGSVVGSRAAIRHGSGFVRRLFLVVVGVLLAKFAYDTWQG